MVDEDSREQQNDIMNTSMSIYEEEDISKLTFRQQLLVTKYRANIDKVNPMFKLTNNLELNDQNSTAIKECDENMADIIEKDDDILKDMVLEEKETAKTLEKNMDNVELEIQTVIEEKENGDNTQSKDDHVLPIETSNGDIFILPEDLNEAIEAKSTEHEDLFVKSTCFCHKTLEDMRGFVLFMEKSGKFKMDLDRIKNRIFTDRECVCKYLRTTMRYIKELTEKYDKRILK